MKHSIYIISGLMASGKSTVAELLAKSCERAVHLHGDLFRRMIVSGRVDMSPEPSDEAVRQLHLRYRMSAICAKEYFFAGFTVFLQDNYYGDELLYIDRLLSDCPHELIVLCPSREAIASREAARNKQGYTSFDVNSLYDAFMESTPRVGYWLDSTELTPRTTAEQIIARFSQ